jgi:hypothetical protein
VRAKAGPVEPKVIVVCPDYRSNPMTRLDAERWIARLTECRHEHEIRPV